MRNKSGFTKTTLYRDISGTSPIKICEKSAVQSVTDERSQDKEVTDDSINMV